jgi:hypothetical protein
MASLFPHLMPTKKCILNPSIMARFGFAPHVTWTLQKSSQILKCAIHAPTPFISHPQQQSPAVGPAQGARNWQQAIFQQSSIATAVAK